MISIAQANTLASNARCWIGVSWQARQGVRIASLWQLIHGTAITVDDINEMAADASCLTGLSSRIRKGIQIDRLNTLANP